MNENQLEELGLKSTTEYLQSAERLKASSVRSWNNNDREGAMHDMQLAHAELLSGIGLTLVMLVVKR